MWINSIHSIIFKLICGEKSSSLNSLNLKMDYVESLGKKFSPFLQTKKLQRTDSKVNLEINAPLAIKQGRFVISL